MRKRQGVGLLIKERRQALQCSQEAVAAAIGVSIKFISLVENCERSLSVEHFPKIAEFLDIPLKQLFQSKLYDEKTNDNLKRVRKELIEGDGEIRKAIALKQLKQMRSQEIDELIRFLEIQRQDYIAKIKIGTIDKQRVEAQIELLREEQELLGLGQLKFNL